MVGTAFTYIPEEGDNRRRETVTDKEKSSYPLAQASLHRFLAVHQAF